MMFPQCSDLTAADAPPEPNAGSAIAADSRLSPPPKLFFTEKFSVTDWAGRNEGFFTQTRKRTASPFSQLPEELSHTTPNLAENAVIRSIISEIIGKIITAARVSSDSVS